MAWYRMAGPLSTQSPDEQLELMIQKFGELMEIGLDTDDEVLHPTLNSYISALPYIETSQWNQDQLSSWVDELKAIITELSMTDANDPVRQTPLIDAHYHLVLCLDRTMEAFIHCLGAALFSPDDMGEDWWIDVYELISYAQELGTIPEGSESSLWDVNPRNETSDDRILFLSNVHIEFTDMLDRWFEHWKTKYPSNYSTRQECFENNFDVDSECWMRYLGFDFDNYFSVKP